jgi:hypothetical protein
MAKLHDRFFPELWSPHRDLVAFVCCRDFAPDSPRWSFSITREALDALYPGADPVDAFEQARRSIYRAADAHMNRNGAKKGHFISADEIRRTG